MVSEPIGRHSSVSAFRSSADVYLELGVACYHIEVAVLMENRYVGADGDCRDQANR